MYIIVGVYYVQIPHYTLIARLDHDKQLIQVYKLVGLPPPHLNTWNSIALEPNSICACMPTKCPQQQFNKLHTIASGIKKLVIIIIANCKLGCFKVPGVPHILYIYNQKLK